MGIIIVNEKIRDFENISLIIYKLNLQLFFDLFAAIIRFILFTSFYNNTFFAFAKSELSRRIMRGNVI